MFPTEQGRGGTIEPTFRQFEDEITGPNARSRLFDGIRPRIVLHAGMFSREDLDRLIIEARQLRRRERAELKQVLAHRRVLLLFAQPSTRTSESFAAAADYLGATARVVSDLGATSFAKGESVEDAAQVFAASYDAIVVRHADPEFVVRLAYGLDRGPRWVPLISAGSGTREHPTQALLDIFTLQDAWDDGVEGKRIAVVGDVARNRTARSLSALLARFPGVHLDVVCPEAFRPESGFIEQLKQSGLSVACHHEGLASFLRSCGSELDALYMTRLQQEYDPLGAGRLGTTRDYVLAEELGPLLGERCRILHPLPRVNELPEVWDRHPHFLVWKQVRNGMWVRAALLASMIG